MRLPELLPLFPLPDQVLLPALPVSFRIFEPRYRALVSALAQQPADERWLAIPRLRPGWQADYEGSPGIFSVAAAALARRIDPQANGEFHIAVEGIVRCELIEVPSDRPYRLARLSELPDAPEPQAQLESGMRDLLDRLAALGSRIELAPKELGGLLAAPGGHSQLVDRLAALLLSESDRRQEVLECRYLSQRMRLVREAIARLSSPPGPPRPLWRPSTN